jgi:transketolase
VLWESPNISDKPEAILIGAGSEVHIALEAAGLLKEKGITARVVSLPSWELYDGQSTEYKESVLPAGTLARVFVEAATTLGLERYIGFDGVAMGIPHFGASAPAGVLYEKFGLTAQRMADEAEILVKRSRV